MEGILGTEASLGSDLSLIFTLVFGIVGVAGAINGRRRRISRHCPVMATGALLNWIPVLLVMVPKWLGVVTGTADVAPGIPSVSALGHGVLGAVTQLLMTYTVARMYWLKDLPPDRPIWLMRATIIVWVLTSIGGVVVYVNLYV
jgi:uncharacterized membrane protein YozB (DUF420 family)